MIRTSRWLALLLAFGAWGCVKTSGQTTTAETADTAGHTEEDFADGWIDQGEVVDEDDRDDASLTEAFSTEDFEHDEDLPTESDFEEEAEAEITPENLEEKLDELEREIEGDGE